LDFDAPIAQPPFKEAPAASFARAIHDNVVNWLTARNFFDALLWGEVRVTADLLGHFGYVLLSGRLVLAWSVLNHEGYFDDEVERYIQYFLETMGVTWEDVLELRTKTAWLRESEIEPPE